MLEDRYARRQLIEPSYTLDELAEMSRTPKKDLLEWSNHAQLGRFARRNGRAVKILTLNEIRALAAEFGWAPCKPVLFGSQDH